MIAFLLIAVLAGSLPSGDHPTLVGTIGSRAVRCAAQSFPVGAQTLASEVFWCRGHLRRSLIVSVNPDGTVYVPRGICRTGPRPPRWAGRPIRHCCELTGTQVALGSPSAVGNADILGLTAAMTCFSPGPRHPARTFIVTLTAEGGA
jgi:hypothetical protein